MTIPISETETQSITYRPDPFGGPDYPVFNYPVTPKENIYANLRGEGHWVPTGNDILFFHPKVVPCHIARGATDEAHPLSPKELGGTDMFGIEWVFDPKIWGSTVRPGNPLLKDANDWKGVIQFPNIDLWDWEGSAQANVEYLDTDLFVVTYLMTGYFERLISFMDFENAIVALIDEDQKEAVKELFSALTDLYIKLIDKYVEYYPGKIDTLMLHDDWGSQMGPFFSTASIEEMLMDEPRRLVAHIKSKGIIPSSHCCGNITTLLSYQEAIGYEMIEAQDLVDKDVFYRDYADKMMLKATPDPLPENASDEQSRAAARAFVDKYFHKGKRTFVEVYYNPLSTPFYEELYIYSRKKAVHENRNGALLFL